MPNEAESLLHAISEAMASLRPYLIEDPAAGAAPEGPPLSRASVALVVRPADRDLDLLLIRRATAPGDPWSGHMAFPGGRRSPADASPQETAERETLEEVGIDLRGVGRALGRLDDVAPRSGAPRILVSAFVFVVPENTAAIPNYEVDLALWVPLSRLAAPGAATDYIHALESGATLRFPAIGYEEHVIWGLTHRIVSQFLEIARRAGEGGVR